MSTLESISPKLTEETLQTILPGATVTSWDVDTCSSRGSSYLSEVSRLNITGVVKDESITVQTFVKALPKNAARRSTFRSGEFFQREIEFYNKIWKGFLDFQQRHNIPNPYTDVPRYL